MRTIRKQKVPKLQDLWQRRRTSTHSQDRRECIDPRFHMMRHKMTIEFRIDDFQHAIHERKTLVHAVHGAPYVARTLMRDQFLESRKRLHLAAGGVQKWATEDVHALHIANLLCVIRCRRFGARAPRQRVPRHHRRVWGATKFRECRRTLPAIDAGLVRVVETPCDGVEHACDAVLRHAPPE